jgi:hypothetical protein
MRPEPRIPKRIGHIYDDLAALAGSVYAETAKGAVTAMIERNGNVVCFSEPDVPDVPAEAIIGTFDAESRVSDIIEDFRAMLRDRARDWIVS